MFALWQNQPKKSNVCLERFKCRLIYLTACFQYRIGKNFQSTRSLLKSLLPVGFELFSFLVLKMGRLSWINHDISLFTPKQCWQCRNLEITLWSSEATALARKASNSIVKHSVCMLCQIKESYDISSFENWLLRWRGELLEMNSSIYLD